MKAEHIIIKNADGTIEERKTIREWIKPLIAKHNETEKKEWGKEAVILHLKDYKFIKEMNNVVNYHDFIKLLLVKTMFYNRLNDGRGDVIDRRDHLMRDLLWETDLYGWCMEKGFIDDNAGIPWMPKKQEA